MMDMLFQPHVVDVARHAELRFRRVFPVSWEAGLKESYQQALERYQKQIELEKQLWQAMQEASALRNRVDILGWFKLNLSELQKAIASGDLSGASEFIARLREEVERREAEERELLSQKERQLGGNVSYTQRYSYVVVQPTQVQQPEPKVETKTIYENRTGGKVEQVTVNNQVSGYYAVNPQGQGICTRDLSYAMQFASQPWVLQNPNITAPPYQFQTPTFQVPTKSTASLFGGPQQFVNPFR